MKQIMDRYFDTAALMNGNGHELSIMIDEAIIDMVKDTESPYKEASAARKINIEISITPGAGDMLDVDYKVTPKAAPYSKVPEERRPANVSRNQMSLGDFLAAENPEA